MPALVARVEIPGVHLTPVSPARILSHMTERTRQVAGAVLVGALLLALFYPVLRWLAGEWLGNDYYSHGPLVPLISAFFAWRLWSKWRLTGAG